jgi:TRAP-type mannitol/chloroaromatic compound transport system substrate-binding protein
MVVPIDERQQDNRTLRTLIITALTETGQTRDALYAKVGEFYYCTAPKYLYKYYSEKPSNIDALRNHEIWYSAPCNFNDIFDCDVSINEKAIFESFLKANPQGHRIRRGSPMWIKLKSLKSDVHKQIDYLQGIFEETKQMTGISCLSESDSSLRM